MLSLVIFFVGNMCLGCALVAYYYTGFYENLFRVCIKPLVVLMHRVINHLVYPHKIKQFNSVNDRLNHINHRTYKNNDYVYNLIIIKHTENL